jgi:hypothetical protein
MQNEMPLLDGPGSAASPHSADDEIQLDGRERACFGLSEGSD